MTTRPWSVSGGAITLRCLHGRDAAECTAPCAACDHACRDHDVGWLGHASRCGVACGCRCYVPADARLPRGAIAEAVEPG